MWGNAHKSERDSKIDASVYLLCKRLLIVTVAFVTIVSFCAGCGKKTESHGYKIVDSGAWVFMSGLEKTIWLDNDRVVSVSNKTLSPGPDPRFLTVWNTSTGKVDLSHEITGLICGRNGQIMFAAKDKTTGIPKHYRGSLENPKEHPMPNPDMHLDDIFYCDWVPKVNPDNFPQTKKLRGNNHLKIVEPKTSTSKGKAFYYEHLEAEGKELPIYPLSCRFTYSEFLDAYMVDNGMYEPSNPERGLFRILERSGNIRDVPIPETMLKGRQYIYPLKNGYLSECDEGKQLTGNPFDDGLLLLRGEKVTRLIVGIIEGVSISPDGCKAAFIHARNSNEYFSQKKPYRTVKFINFCKGENKP